MPEELPAWPQGVLEEKKGETMSNNNRVLGRRGARDLDAIEIDAVSAAGGQILVCTALQHTGTVTGGDDAPAIDPDPQY